MRLPLLLSLAGIGLAAVALSACPKNGSSTTEEPVAPVGWQDNGDWSCYAPPPELADGDRLTRSRLRQEVLDEYMNQFNGQVDEGFTLDERRAERFQLAFLTHPDKLDAWATELYSQCQSANSMAAYQEYLGGVNRAVMAGECVNPFIFEVHHIFDLGGGWQNRYHVCDGNRIRIEATRDTAYKVSDDSAEVDVMGHQGERAGDRGPCPECAWGSLLVRFEPEGGGDPIIEELGYERDWTAPGHGWISFAVNDNVAYDNAFRERNGVIDYVAIAMYSRR